MYRRYCSFKDIKIGPAGEPYRKKLFQDMLEFEDGLVWGDAIGEVRDIIFTFKVKDETPIRHKPIQYARPEREFIREDMAKMCKLGILREILPGEEEPIFVVGLVLVKDG